MNKDESDAISLVAEMKRQIVGFLVFKREIEFLYIDLIDIGQCINGPRLAADIIVCDPGKLHILVRGS